MTPRTLEIAPLREPPSQPGRLGKKLIALFVFFLAAQAAHATTYYIDYASGANSNAGTKASPWKTHPYMQTGASCTGTGSAPTYTHSAGDQFIFKGGVTWPAACFRMAISLGGNSSVSDYYGVDKTWFTGGSWTRPIFDMANTVPTGGGAFITTARYVTIDNLELKRLGITSGTAECADANINASAGNVTVENMYIHDWTMSTIVNYSTNHGDGSICQSGAPGPVNAYNNVISDKNTTAVAPFGECFRNLTNVEGNDCEYTAEGEVGHFGNTDDNIFANLDGNIVAMHDTINHTNVIHMSDTAAGDGPVFNNLIHDNQSGVTIFTCAATDVYNNVIYNNYNAQIMYSTSTNDCPGVNTSTVGNVYNNTVDCSNGAQCFRSVQRSSGMVASIINIRNNIFISNGSGTAVSCYNNTGAGCGNISASSLVDHNRTMTTTEASTYGFVSSGKYSPSSADPNTAAQGANLVSLCSGTLSALCQDATGTFWFGGSFKARPTGSTPWDLGAYQFQGGSTGPPSISISSPSPGTVSGSVSLTATCTPQGSATVSSIQFSIDGIPFGLAGTSSPYTISWNTATAANATHVIGATCTDSNAQVGTAATVSVKVSNSIPGCFISTDNDSGALSWTANQSFTAQTTNFTATFTATPNTNNQNTVIALSQAPMSAYSQGAALVRFNSSGQIDVYKGSLGNYTADTTVSYTAGTTYAFTFTVNMTAGTYTVALTSPTSVTLATGYSFRTTASATSLGYINAISGNTTPDTAQVCNFQIGSAASLTFSPASLNFGNITVGGNATQTITATTSGGSVNFSTVASSGNADFTINSNTCSGSVPTSCTTQIKFAPTSAALETATVTYADDATGSPQSVAISGTGVPATPTLSINPASVNFGGVQVHTTSSSGPIVLTISSGPVTFTGTPSFSGPSAADFALASNTCTGTVSAASCQTVVSFTPSLVAAESATLSYTDSATGSPQSVALTGSGYLAPHPPTAVHATVN